MTKFLYSILLSAVCIMPAMADDSGLGIEVGATKKINTNLSADVEGEFRTQDGLSNVERWSAGASLEYKFTKWLKADAGYSFIARRYPDKTTSKNWQQHYWSPRHRGFVSLTATWKLPAHLDLSLRERYQYTYETEQTVIRYKLSNGNRNDKVKGGDSESMLRSRLQLKWSRKRCPWAPYVNAEMHNDISGMAIDQMRYIAGIDYKLSKQNTFGLSYRYKSKNNDDEDKGHLVSLSYKYKF